MCNLYSVTTNQAAIIALARAMRDSNGNRPTYPGVFPDYMAPIVRNAPDGVRELCTTRLQQPLADGTLKIVAAGTKKDGPADGSPV